MQSAGCEMEKNSFNERCKRLGNIGQIHLLGFSLVLFFYSFLVKVSLYLLDMFYGQNLWF